LKKISILGSTGSIGAQALDVIRSHPGKFKIVGLACKTDSLEIRKQIKEFRPEIFSIAERDGEEGILKVATWPSAEMVVVAVVGIAGLLPTLEAIRAGKDIALATKEVLVLAGELVMNEVKKYKVNLIPVDSEHSAIFQSLKSGEKGEIRHVILTMGKGPIAKMPKDRLGKVTMKEVLNRPAWKMGTKITIDAATGMNKSFEVVEAKWLFGVSGRQIQIVVHPEYLCHSLIEFVDGSIIGEFGTPDMRRYIHYALFYPQREKGTTTSFVNLVGKAVSFEPTPFKKFPCLSLGFAALKAGGTMPAAMHGADATAVEAFSKGKVSFAEIFDLIKLAMETHRPIRNPSLKEILEVEKWARDFTQKVIN